MDLRKIVKNSPKTYILNGFYWHNLIINNVQEMILEEDYIAFKREDSTERYPKGLVDSIIEITEVYRG